MAKLKILTMRDIEAEPVRWLWEPYIPAGKITIVQGDGGEGKTTMALAIAAAITRGDPLPGEGRLPGNYGVSAPAHVIIQNAEDGIADTIIPRLEQLGADDSMVHFIDEDEEALSLSDDRIEKTILRTSAALCVLDPIQAYLGGANMNSAGSVRSLTRQLGAVAARTGCAILLVGHLGKKSGKSQYRGLGSIDLYAAARSVLTVGRIDEATRAVVHNKSNLAPAGASLAFEIDPVHGFRWQGECDVSIDDLLNGQAVKPENQFARARRLIETTLTHGPVAAVEITRMAEKQGISLKTLNRAKSALGVISEKRVDGWYWNLPIDVEYTVYDAENQDGQGSQDGHVSPVASLTILPGGRL